MHLNTLLMIPNALSFLVILSLDSLRVNAFSTKITSVTRHPSLAKRAAPISGSPTTDSEGNIPVNNEQNTQYTANITISGSAFQVIIDTGSADLWVAGDIQKTTDTGLSTSIQYAVGKAAGDINTAEVEFAGYTIPEQAYLLVQDTSTFTGNLTQEGISGLLGLGPSYGSVIRSTVGNSTGNTVLDSIFNQNTSTPNFISFLLDRAGDPTQPFTGELTVGEVISPFNNITSQPQLPVQVLSDSSRSNQHWTITLDQGEGIIGPDGQPIKVSSIVPDNGGKLFAVIDSGFTLPQVPRTVSDAIYGRVQGANFSVENEVWTIPCGQELNISFLIGGVKFPIHPLDTSSSDFGMTNAEGQTVCVGIFQPITSAFSINGQFDMILGMGFLRNAYALLDFGDFVDGSASTVGDPYVQLVSTTDPTTAHSDFVKARLKGIDTTSAPQYTLLSKGKTSPVPDDERVQHVEQKVIRYLPAIIIGASVIFALTLGLCLWRYFARRKARRQASAAAASIAKGFRNPYKTLDDPAPPPMRMDAMGNRPGRNY